MTWETLLRPGNWGWDVQGVGRGAPERPPSAHRAGVPAYGQSWWWDRHNNEPALRDSLTNRSRSLTLKLFSSSGSTIQP